MAINYLAVLVAAIASMIIGMMWYSPKGLFGKQWMQLSGFDKLSKQQTAKMQQEGKKSMPIAFVSALVMAYVLSRMVSVLGATTWMAGAVAGFWLWLGFVATVLLGGVLWEQKPVKLYYINALHYLVTLAVMGAIVAM